MNGLIRTIPRYLVVSGIFALLGMCILIGLDHLGLHYIPSLVLAYVTLVPASYFVHAGYTYRVPPEGNNLIKYMAAQAVNLPLAILLLYIFHDLLALPMTIASPLLLVGQFVYNLAATHCAIYLNAKPKDQPQ